MPAVRLTLTQQAWLCAIVGAAIITAFPMGPALLTFVGIILVGPLGLFRLFFRAVSRITKHFENAYFLKRWQDQFDTSLGQFSSWYLGVDRDGKFIR